jgi:hypothetical protein
MTGFVYLITMEPDEFVKIGYTKSHPRSRLDNLQTGCPMPLRLMAYFPATMEDEKRLHMTFDELRYRGEWFYVQDKLRDLLYYLEDLQAPLKTRAEFEGGIHDCVITDIGPWAVSETCDASFWNHLEFEYES